MKVRNTTLKPILLRAGGKTITVAFEDTEVGDIKKLRKNKVINSFFKDGLLVPVEKEDEKSDDRLALEAEAKGLGIQFPANIKDENLQAKVDEELAKD